MPNSPSDTRKRRRGDEDCAIVVSDDTRPRKKAKMKVAAQKIWKDYSETWPFIRQVKADSFAAKSTVCGITFTVKHGGANDVQRHINSVIHEQNKKSKKKNMTLDHSGIRCSAHRTRSLHSITIILLNTGKFQLHIIPSH